MAEKTISMELDGYWRDVNKGSIPAKGGVYCVYECSYNQQEKTVSLQTLIYIGESDDAKERIADHEKREQWLKYVKRGNVLCFSFGAIGASDRYRAEAAMIFKHKPPVNTEYTDAFPFDKTTMSLSGKTSLLTTKFTVDRT